MCKTQKIVVFFTTWKSWFGLFRRISNNQKGIQMCGVSNIPHHINFIVGIRQRGSTEEGRKDVPHRKKERKKNKEKRKEDNTGDTGIQTLSKRKKKL